MDDQEAAWLMGQRARAHVQQEHEIGAMVRKYEDVYMQLLSLRPVV
jgi:hypothetical protein